MNQPSQLETLRSALRDIADYGTRHDIPPTMEFFCDGEHVRYSVVYGYIASMDRSVRDRARKALEKIGDMDEGRP